MENDVSLLEFFNTLSFESTKVLTNDSKSLVKLIDSIIAFKPDFSTGQIKVASDIIELSTE